MNLRKANTAPLSFIEKVGYGLGDMASNFYMGFFGIFLLYYYTDVWGISPAAAATMFLVTKIIDAVSDPAMGLLADRTETRWGKYRPYLLWMAVPYAALGYLLFLGPDLSETGKIIFAYVSYSLVMLGYTAINVPYSALLAVISPVAKERIKATQFRFVFASLGTLIVGATTKPLVDWLGGGNELLGFRLTIILFAILTVALFWITFATTKERITPKKHDSSAKEDMAVLLKNISWIVLAIAGILVVIGLISRISSAAFYVKYYIAFGEDKVLWWMDRTTLLITLGFVGQLFGALLTPTFLKIVDKRQLMIFMNILHATLLAGSYFIPPDHYWFIVLFYATGIFCFGVIITLLFAMYTDCAEYGEWKSGKNSAGLTVSASMFSLKTGSAFGSAIPGFILAAFGFVANEIQTSESIQGIRLMFSFVPAIFFFAAGLLMVFYKLDGNTVKKMERALLKRRSKEPSI
ncbi:MAG: MFS transporter [Robiginitomaculum sp.]|nr:MFS transporter [Robiginitomaculum sp.]